MNGRDNGRPHWTGTSFFVLVAAIAVLYFAQDVIMPVALAGLLSFILTPVVLWFERIGLNRVMAVAVSVAVALLALSALTYVVGNQFFGLLQDLPQYKQNLRQKIRPLGKPLGSGLDETARTVKELAEEIKPPAKESVPSSRTPKVQVVAPPPSGMEQLRTVFEPVIGPLATGGVVIVFLLFMLLERDALRERVIRLTGTDINRTTRALAEATHRVTRYLAMQTLINSLEGGVWAAGLYAIGVPNALLWGVLLVLLRFIPYLGVWVAALFPVMLAVAVFDDWTHMLMTAGLIVVLEIATSQFIEPVLYGHHTGVSPLALLIAAVFWTWLWGPPGLFLAIPLTVSLVVLGKYLPQLAFLGVLMGDQPVFEPWERFYQRLLARAAGEADEVVEEAQKTSAPREVADTVLLPAMAMVERDFYRGAMGEAQRRTILVHIDAVIEDLFERGETRRKAGSVRAICLPVYGEADEIAARMFTRVLEDAGIDALAAPPYSDSASLLEAIRRERPQCVCLCTFPPAGMLGARRLCRRLHEHMPSLVILAALWDLPDIPDVVMRRFSAAGVRATFTRLSDGVDAVRTADREPPQSPRRSQEESARV